MSKKVDERVVEMRFDNKQFEAGVKDTMSTLDKFKQKLQFKDATKGLDDLEKSAKKLDLNPLSKAADTVSMRFSAMQVAGVTALANITNSAVNAGKNIAKALTIDPVITGFQEYETQINAIQTILANTESKGSTLQDVNSALAELNTYADMTIYNFTEMTRNIGTFTAAGVDLKTSVSAIKGIANLAAVSGSNSLQASTAMYQLSQALAAGKVSLMDWNSVVNAGMGGQVFQDALKETARVHGVAIDDMIKKRGSFRETLQDGWLTAEVLTETLSKFTGDLSAEQLKQMGYTEQQIEQIIKMGKTANDAATKVKTFTQLFDTLKEAAQSGWTRSWEIMVGDFEEAKNFLTDVSDRLGEIIGKSADARNEMLSGGLSSGWKQLLNAGIADEEGYKETFKSIAKEHGASIDDMIAAEKELDDSLTDSEAFQKSLKKGFSDGKISADMLTESVHKMADKMGNMSAQELEAAGYTAKHVEQIKALSSGLKDGSVSMDEFVKKITRTSGRENIIQALWNAFEGLMNIITPIKEAFREIFPRTTGEQLYDITVKIENITAKFKELTEKNVPKLKSTFKGIFSVLKIGVTIIKSIISGIATLIEKLTGLSGGILDITGAIGDWISGMAKGINEANLFGKAIDGIVGFLGGAIDAFKEFTGAIKEKVTANGFEWFLNLMNGIWNVIQRIGSAIGKVAAAIGSALANAFRNGDFKSLLDILNGGLFATILLGIKKYISGLTDKLDDAVGFVDKIKDVLGTVEDSLKSWQQNLQSGTIKNIAIAIGILAASLWVLSGIDSDKMGAALGGIGTLMAELMGAMWLFTKITADAKSALKGIPVLIGISAAIFILASALKKISDLDWKQLGVGLTGIAGLMIILIGTAKILSTEDEKKIQMGAMQMVIMAIALKILASVCKDLSELNWEQLGKGVSGITGILIAFAGFQALMKKIQPENMLRSATSLILIGVAMELLADVSAKFGKMKWGDLGKAGAAIAGILVIAAGFGKLSSYAGKMFSSSVALILIGSAMEIFADAANKFGQMKWQDLGKAGVAIASILLLASGFAVLANKSDSMFGAVISLTIMAAAMEIFADVCEKFSTMKWEELGKAGAAISGILALAVGFSLLAGKTDGMWKSAAALLVIAVALKVLTPVLTALGNMSVGQIVASLVTLAGGLAILIGAAAIIKTAGLIPAMLSMAGAVALIGVACLAAGAGIMMFAAGFTALAAAGAAGATAFVAAITVIIVGLLELIPSIIDEITAAIVAICNVIIKSAPAIGEAIKALVLTIIDVLVECVPALAEGFLQLLIGVMEALVQYTPQIVDLLFDFILAVINGITERLPEYMGAIANLIVTFINGLAEHVPEFVAAGINLFGAIVQGIADAIEPILDILKGAIVEVVDSIAQALPGLADVISASGETIRSTLSGIADVFDSVFGGIADVITSVGDSIRNVLDGIADIISSIGEAALDAGTGFENLANGVKTITKLDLIDMAASMAAVATGIGKIAKHSKGLAEAGTGIKQIADGTELSASAFDRMAYGIMTVISSFEKLSSITGIISSVITSIVVIIDSSKVKIISAITSLIAETITVIKEYHTEYSSAGSYLVDGFSKGIDENTFKAEAKAKAMALKALEAAKKALDERSPSKKFMKVGAFVVSGFAKGIAKNVGEANKASVKMANGVLTSTQDALGIHSPSVVFDEKVGRYIVQGVAEGIKKDMSAEEAAEKKAQNIVSAFKNALDDIDLRISNREKDFDLWQLTDGKTASDVAVVEKQRKQLNDNLWDYNQQVKLTTDKYLTLKETLGENNKYTQEAYGAMRDAQITAANTASSLIAVDETFYDDNIQKLEDSASRRDREDEYWEAIYGDDASAAKRFAHYAKRDAQNIEEAQSKVKHLKDKYNNYLKEYAELNHVTIDIAKQSDEAKQIAKDVEEAQIAEAKAKQQQRNRQKDYLEQEKEDLKDQYELTSEIADIRYQIWEKTIGRKATDAEKDTMKLAFLTEQLGAQAKLVEMAKDAWENSDADEAQKLEKEYLSAKLELANLQSEVLDIQEENIKRQERALDRQRNAQSEYNDYIKKYEKYYLEHGMTREELEKDAKLVSGYDPSKLTEKAISKTNTAIDNVKMNVSNLTKAVGEGIQNGISDVTDNTTSMLKSCAKVLNSEKDTWTRAGSAMVDGLIQGITSKTDSAVKSVTDLVSRMLAAIQDVCENGMDYTPTITPVLDMSSVTTQASRLNSMINGNTSFGLASSVSKLTRDVVTRMKASQSDDTHNYGTTYSFTQNNYSPKALSSSEIYRQSKNMISRAINKNGRG